MRLEEAPWPVHVDFRLLCSILAKTGRVHECELEEPEAVAFNDDYTRSIFHYRTVTYCITYAYAPRGTFVIEARAGASIIYKANGNVLRAQLHDECPAGTDPLLEALRKGPGPGRPELN